MEREREREEGRTLESCCLGLLCVCDGPSLMEGGVLPPSFPLILSLGFSLRFSLPRFLPPILSPSEPGEKRHSLLPSLVCFIPSHRLTLHTSTILSCEPHRLLIVSSPSCVVCLTQGGRKEQIPKKCPRPKDRSA